MVIPAYFPTAQIHLFKGNIPHNRQVAECKAKTRNRSRFPTGAAPSGIDPARHEHFQAVPSSTPIHSWLHGLTGCSYPRPMLRPMRRWTRTCNGGMALPHPRPLRNGTKAATSRVSTAGWLMHRTYVRGFAQSATFNRKRVITCR
jgi:hypothetical protein